MGDRDPTGSFDYNVSAHVGPANKRTQKGKIEMFSKEDKELGERLEKKW